MGGKLSFEPKGDKMVADETKNCNLNLFIMTRKDFVLQVTESLKANPKAVLAGHGINAAVLKAISERPDVMAKLAVLLFSTKMASKGANGLKKREGFKICGYKSFPDFNKLARTDVSDFMETLNPQDAETFSNEENILTILCLPDTSTGQTSADIVSGKSVMLEFSKAVRAEFKIQGGFYITVMFGDSVITPKEAAKAEAKEAVNAKLSAKKNPARIKATLARKAKNRLALLEVEKMKLQAKKNKTAAQLQQFNVIGDATGGARGNSKVAIEAREARKKELRKSIRMITKQNEGYLAKLSDEVTVPSPSMKTYLKKKIQANSAIITNTRAKLRTLDSMTQMNFKTKAKLLAQVEEMINGNVMKGASVSQALEMAIAKLPATEDQKDQIKQQVIQQTAAGVPSAYAMQQAIQSTISDADLDAQNGLLDEPEEDLNFPNAGDSTLAGNKTIEDIMNML